MLRKAWPWLVVFLLATASVAPSPFVTLWPDTVRDLSASLALVRGESVPLAGPPINFGPHLGPAWIWLQAIPLLFSKSLVAVAVFVAAIASLRFVLLYELGRRIEGPMLGLCFAAAGGFPSVAVYQWHGFFHPDWVAPAIVASLVCLVAAMQSRSRVLLIASAALLGLAVQFHPTAIFYLPLHLLVGRRMFGTVRERALAFAAMTLAIAVWFVPLAWDGNAAAAAKWQSIGGRMGSGLAAFHASEVVTVLRTAYASIPLAIGDTYGAAVGIPQLVWRAMWFVAMGSLAAALGLWLASHRATHSRVALALLAMLIAGWAIATAVRTYTSFYLVYFLLPLSAIVLGLGFRACLASQLRAMRWLGASAVGAAAVMHLAAAAGAVIAGMSGALESRLPSLGDLRHPSKGVISARMMSVTARDTFARAVCQDPADAGVHGDLAYAWAASLALDLRLHCPLRADSVRLFGGDRNEWTVLTRSEAKALRREVRAEAAGLALVAVRRSIAPESRPLEPDWYYFEQLRDRRAMTLVTLDFVADATDAVMIYRLKPFDSRWQNLRVEADGVAKAATWATFDSGLYTAEGAKGNVRWRVSFETDAPQWVDVDVL